MSFLSDAKELERIELEELLQLAARYNEVQNAYVLYVSDGENIHTCVLQMQIATNHSKKYLKCYTLWTSEEAYDVAKCVLQWLTERTEDELIDLDSWTILDILVATRNRNRRK